MTSTHIDQARLDALLQRAQREIDSGLLPSCQLAVAHEGEVIVNEVFGDASLDTRYVIFSATKAVVAGAVWMLLGEGALDEQMRVADLIPEFGTNGKDAITLEQVMLHTAGFPAAPLGPPQWFTREGRLAAFSKWRLNWEPGTKYEYHATSAHWVLAELITRVTGEDHRDFIRTRLTEPLGIGRLQVGVPENEQGDLATLVSVGEMATADELQEVFGVTEMPQTEVTEEALLQFNRPDVRALGVPGGGAVSTAEALALYYQALLHNPGGLWKPEVLEDVTTRVRNRLPDPLRGIPANRSLGLILAGDDGRAGERGLGRTVSPGAFGHNGAGGQLAWADPASGLSFVYLTNGLDAHVIRQGRRDIALASLAGTLATPA